MHINSVEAPGLSAARRLALLKIKHNMKGELSMEILKIAIPSEAPGGLDSERSGHFGHCPMFTLVELDGNKIGQVSIVHNQVHEAGGCMQVVGLLKKQGVEALVVHGMGRGPFMGMQKEGISVYFADQSYNNVAMAVDGFLQQKLPQFQAAQLCTSNGNCHH